ncbi:MAG: hypothetical protein WAW06_05880 [bacterium]
MGRKRGGEIRWTMLAIILLGLAAGCGGLQLASVLRTGEVSVDGVPDEWQGAITYIEDPNVTLGVMNDDQYLYLCFSTPLKSVVTQILRQGLTVWFDADGGKDKTFGIHCPLAAPAAMPDTTRAPDRHEDPRAFGGALAKGIREAAGLMEIVGPGKDQRAVLTPSEGRGIEVRLGAQDGRIVYELRVPLIVSDTHPFAIAAKAVRVVGVGFDAPAAAAQGRGAPPEGGQVPGGFGGDGPEGGGPGGGRPGGGPEGGGPGGMGGAGRPQGPQGETTEPLEVWCKVKLASS